MNKSLIMLLTLMVCVVAVNGDLIAGRETVELKRSGNDLDMTFTNRAGDEINIKPYTIVDELFDIEIQDDWFGLGGDLSTPLTAVPENEYFILQNGAYGDITDVYKITDIDDANNQVEIYSVAKGTKKIIDVGEEIDDTGRYVCDGVGDAILDGGETTVEIMNEACAAVQSASDLLITENKMRITLGTAAGSGPAIIKFSENAQPMNTINPATILSEVDVTISSNSDPEIEISGVDDGGLGSIYQTHNEDATIEYTLTVDYGTYFVRNEDLKNRLIVYINDHEDYLPDEINPDKYAVPEMGTTAVILVVLALAVIFFVYKKKN